jgi:hypothetical protein
MDRLELEAGTLEGTAHLALLLLVPAGTAALFAVVLGSLSVRHGEVQVALALLLFSLFAFAYSAWSKGQPLLQDLWPDGLLWGVSLAAFAVIAGRVLARSPAKTAARP